MARETAMKLLPRIRKAGTALLAPCLIAASMLAPCMRAQAAPIDDIWDEISVIEGMDDTIAKTEKLANKYRQITELGGLSLAGMHVTAIGDSITDFGGWFEEFCRITGCSGTNLGIGGAAIGDYWDENSLILRWSQIPSDSDIIFVYAGLNDYYADGPMGDKGEGCTYCGDTWALLSNIRYAYPNADIYAITTYRTNSVNWEQFCGRSLDPYMDVLKSYAEELGIGVIDLYSTGYLDSADEQTRAAYVPDEVHTNSAGAELLAYAVAAGLAEKY